MERLIDWSAVEKWDRGMRNRNAYIDLDAEENVPLPGSSSPVGLPGIWAAVFFIDCP
jgi:hypothetical protein